MEELEIAILIVVSFLLLLSVANMAISWKRYKKMKRKYIQKKVAESLVGGAGAPGMEGYDSGSLLNESIDRNRLESRNQ